MDRITFSNEKVIDIEKLKILYEDAGWVSYTKDIPLLQKAVERSLYVISAWDERRLIGLIRVVGDGLTIVYIQDLLVLNGYRRMGIGSDLLGMITAKYGHVRHMLLLTDNQTLTRAFYLKSGFIDVQQHDLIAYMRKI